MFKKKKKQRKKKNKSNDKTEPSKSCYGAQQLLHQHSNGQLQQKQPDDVSSKIDGMENWLDLRIPNPILRCLKELGFTNPTPIQSRVLPSAIEDKMDIIGAAETGSGKTLAFAIPIVTHILNLNADDDDDDDDDDVDTINNNNDTDVDEESQRDTLDVDDINDEEDDDDDEVLGKMHNDDKNDHHHPHHYHHHHHNKPMYALVITPTRELAIQIREHIDNVTKYTDVKCLAIVGGMSIERQNRLLKKFSPQIVVATPGRFWELVQQKCPHLSHVKDLRFLVIDEADRMIEKNHFEELEKIMNYINLNLCSPLRRQNFVFSATLTFIHKTPYRFDVGKKKKMKELTLEDKLASLQRKLHMSSKPEVVDLTGGQKMTAQKLTELKVNCTYQEKDLYLYYFLKNNKGRTLVFANSKDCIRRLTSLLAMLHCKPLPLHADMHQKQRLKNLDRFKENERGLLLATDVAARGLDIPNVKHVIHYQVPRTTENYVHRSGRTARSNTAGISLALVCPEEVKLFNGIQAALKRGIIKFFNEIMCKWMNGLVNE
ncbi:hypothetical protein HELRODRAFT_83529 [Helobdella robusta]|uniref:ATP-dependent RNA helicase n=1 Tax=Helobdella robusta TaxID=6412 RepID=T1G567_HELRO|nr:hypothetical protein HELRODRAFT_83529 [Helobdella robusta]ESO00088.1 hypothetical protein HELRODRAFT_83529 [Helobdella robusta]